MDDAAKRLIYERNGAGPPRRGPTGSLGSSSDPEGRRIIEARNTRARYAAFGRASALTAEDAQLLARMQTNRQARAVLGVVAQYLRQGYDVAATVPSFISPIDGTRMAAAQMRSTLDQTNTYAQRVYATIPNDDAPVSDLTRKKVAEALKESRSVLALVSTDAADLNRGLSGALLDLLEKHLLPQPFQTLDPKTKKTLLIVGGVIVGLIVLSLGAKLVHTIMFGEASALGEAEEAAVVLAEAERRKRRKRRVLTIS